MAFGCQGGGGACDWEWTLRLGRAKAVAGGPSKFGSSCPGRPGGKNFDLGEELRFNELDYRVVANE